LTGFVLSNLWHRAIWMLIHGTGCHRFFDSDRNNIDLALPEDSKKIEKSKWHNSAERVRCIETQSTILVPSICPDAV
jgi:hypothetical protein